MRQLRVAIAVVPALALAVVASAGGMVEGASLAAHGQVSYVRPLDARHSPYIHGNRSPRLPAGRQGRIDIIKRGTYDGNSLPIVVRNNTSQTAIRIKVTGVAKSTSGKLLATGADQTLYPNVVKPGEIAFGYVYFSGANLPANARFGLTASWDRSLAQYENIRDLVITQAAQAGDRVVGMAQNRYRVVVSGPISAGMVCFSSSSTLLGDHSDFADQDRVSAGGRLPFQVETLGDPCPVFLVGVKGFTQ